MAAWPQPVTDGEAPRAGFDPRDLLALQDADRVPLSLTRLVIPLQEYGQYWIGPADLTDPAIAIAEAHWQPMRADHRYPLADHQALWLRMRLGPSRADLRWRFEIPSARTDRVELFRLLGDGRWESQVAGDRVARHAWPVPSPYPAIPLLFSSQEDRWYLARIENAGGFAAPVEIRNVRFSLMHEVYLGQAAGLMAGLALAFTGLCAAAAAWLRMWRWVHAGAVALTAVLVAWSTSGYASLLLWPGWPAWADRADFVLGAMAMAAMTLLSAQVMGQRHLPGGLRLALRGLVMAGALGLPALSIVLAAPLRLPTLVAGLILCSVVLSAAWLAAWSRRTRWSVWMPLAWNGFFVGLWLATAEYQVPWLPASWVDLNLHLLGLAVPLGFTAWLLVTSSLPRAGARLNAMGAALVDATGQMCDRPTLERRLPRYALRAQASGGHCLLLMLQIRNLDALRSEFGLRTVQTLPARLAGRLLSRARDIDTVAQFDDRRFALLVEGPVTPDRATAMAQALVADGLKPWRNLPASLVLQLSVLHVLLPRPDSEAAAPLVDRLLAQLERLARDRHGRVIQSVPPVEGSAAPASPAD